MNTLQEDSDEDSCEYYDLENNIKFEMVDEEEENKQVKNSTKSNSATAAAGRKVVEMNVVKPTNGKG